MTPPDEDLPAQKREVECLIGRCLLRLQAFERLTKSILVSHRISAPIAELEEAKAIREADTRRKTLGVLVGEMMGSFLVPEGQEGLREEREDAPSVDLTMQIILPAEDFARIEADHRELVALRNTLVHHFLEQHDLCTVDGCLVAQQTLTTALDHIDRAYGNLLLWAKNLEKTQKALADALASPEVYGLIVQDRIPWPVTTITEALYEAAAQIAPGGWAPVEAAIEWINQRYPEEQPEGYGCRTWRQVIHETALFDLQVRKVDGRRRALYRPRNKVASQI